MRVSACKAFGMYLGHEGGVLRNGISAFIGSWRDQSSPLPPHEVTEGRAAYEPGRVPQPDKQSASTLMRGYTASTTVRNTFLLFISPQAMVFGIPEQTKRVANYNSHLQRWRHEVVSKSLMAETSLVVQWLRHPTSTAGGMGLIPSWGTSISHATQCGLDK